MTAGVTTVVYPVKDLDGAKALFRTLLGTEPYADTPYYVGFKDAGQDIALDPQGHAKGLTGAVPYWHVTDIQGTLARLVEAGAEVVQDVQEVGGGRRIASLKDRDGNALGLLEDTPEA